MSNQEWIYANAYASVMQLLCTLERPLCFEALYKRKPIPKRHNKY